MKKTLYLLSLLPSIALAHISGEAHSHPEELAGIIALLITVLVLSYWWKSKK
ncbi:hypothetical protein [Vibrio sonorensis]|uniref:hypothetical protein n=1 Tax=Vibrio sonorensis TaxID=1004316 RepID=UPI0015864079|nr:hypothetical protein [Vibrio sonorensis]